MSQRPGSGDVPLRVCTVGSGPSAFYATEALQKAGLNVRVDMFDRLPTPFGLVRGGVAPDHQKIKSVVKVYEKISADPSFRFFGNVKLGRDLEVKDLERHYHAIVWAIGCESDNRLGIPGEDLAGVHSATEFVGWYNGHPDFRDRAFDLAKARRIAVVGNGNVAMDVSRVLLQDPEILAATDIADHAVAALRRSNVQEVLLLGRRGPAQAAFSPKEIEEIDELPHVDVVVTEDEARLDDYSRQWLGSQPRSAQRNVAFLEAQAQKGEGSAPKKLRCRFLVAPVEIDGGVEGNDGRVAAVRVQRAELHPDANGTPRPRPIDRYETLPVDLVFKSIGYRGLPLPGLPFDDKKGIVPNRDGRVLRAAGGDVLPGHYVVGWAKRGPTGLVGTNSPDSKATVQELLADVQADKVLGCGGADIAATLQQRGVDFVTWQDWQRLDAWEQEQGKARGKVRHKEPSVEALMAAVRRLRSR
ncbi:MAG: NADP oxidoreductase [Planctomycetota bacterium]